MSILPTPHIHRAAVIGAGSMGSGIAAHLANAGIDVLLLDRPSDSDNRNEYAEGGVKRQLKSHGFFTPECAERVTVGNVEDDAAALGDVEWIIEAIYEDLGAKHEIYRVIEQHRNEESVVSSNTSTIPLERLTENMAEDMRTRFAITHFFNPPRVMRLVELVVGPDTSQEAENLFRTVCELDLGKAVIDCRDTPGFIANRIGNLWMATGARQALDNGISPELADAVFSAPFGIPRTGIFGLFDYIGLQLLPHVWGSLEKSLESDDAINSYKVSDHPLFTTLIDRGLTGRTGESGIYRGRGEVFDLESGDYRPREEITDPAARLKDPRAVMDTDSPAGRYARGVFVETLRYCLTHAEAIADRVSDIDAAMVHGYGWKRGPFALADAVGLDWCAEALGDSSPLLDAARKAGGFYPNASTTLSTTGEPTELPRVEGAVTVADVAAEAEVIERNEAGTLYRRSDGIALLALGTPLNTLNEEALQLVEALAARTDVSAAVVGNDNERAFSAGAFLPLLFDAARQDTPDRLTNLLRRGCEAFAALRTASFPVVAAARGVAFGGGLELLQHCTHSVLHVETTADFPEPTVGLLPGWGGCVRTLDNAVAHGSQSPQADAVRVILNPKRLRGAHTILGANVLAPDSARLEMNIDRVLGVALRWAEQLADGFTPRSEAELPLFDQASADELREAVLDQLEDEVDRALADGLIRLYTHGEDGASIRESELSLAETRTTVQLLRTPAHTARAEKAAARFS